jgi:hypothetical protein
VKGTFSYGMLETRRNAEGEQHQTQLKRVTLLAGEFIHAFLYCTSHVITYAYNTEDFCSHIYIA